MKFRYKKRGKFNYQGTQLHRGDIIERDDLGGLPGDWFEAIEEKPAAEVVEEKPKRKAKKIEPKEEVIEDGVDDEDSDEDLGS